jgi:glycosyltransferase involved in cell wall biosynthesis
MKETINMLHLSSLGIWDLGQNKGRASTYLPLKGFVDRGHIVHFITIDKRHKTENIDGINFEQVRLPIYPIPKKRLHNLTRLILLPITTICLFFSVLKRYKKNKPDVIYSHSTETAVAAYFLAKRFKSKYVLRLYGFPKFKKETFLYKILKLDRTLSLLLKADLYILTNDGTGADKAVESFGISKDKIHFLKNGIDKSYINRPIDNLLKKKLTPNQEKIILSVSRLVNWKQVDLIIMAIPSILEKEKNIKLIVVGDGVERKNLESLVQKLNIEKHVYFTGAIEQNLVVDYIKIADLFISMNALSGMNNPVFEAMICGKSVIALNTGDTKNLIKDNETGILLDPSKIGELSKVILDILRDDVKRGKIGTNAQRFMNEEWPSWDDRVNYEIDLIEKFIFN